MVHNSLFEFKQAKFYFHKALTIYSDLDEAYDIGQVFLELGNLSMDENEMDAAKDYYLKALKIYEDLNDTYLSYEDVM